MKHCILIIKGVIKSLSLETPFDGFENTAPLIGEKTKGNSFGLTSSKEIF